MDWYAVIGIVLALAGLKYLWDVPREVRPHDRKVRNRNDDLVNWIDDTKRDLRRELIGQALRHVRSQQVQLPPYLRAYQKQKAKDEVVKRLGDQVRDANRYREEIELGEQLPHRLWRRLPWGSPLPQLTALVEKAGTIAWWKEPVVEDDGTAFAQVA
jgi:hypothetical protein